MKKYFIILLYFFAFAGIVFVGVFFAMQLGLLNVPGSIDERNAFFGEVQKVDNIYGCINTEKPDTECSWTNTAEWVVVREGLIKDKDIIMRVASEVGISPRMIAAAVVPEQVRFFTSNRETFKRYFEPMKLLGSMSKFSLGVSGIKQETADDIEKYANDGESVFYPGRGISDLLKYKSDAQHSTELYSRLTDPHDHYYSYLYTAVYLKEIESQWLRAGYDISDRPDVLVTLFNLGFEASVPKINPQVSGSVIEVGGQKYTFGMLGSLFYKSSELREVFQQ